MKSAEINLSRKQADEALKRGDNIKLDDVDTLARRLVEYRNTDGSIKFDAQTKKSYKEIYDDLTKLYGTDIGTGWGWTPWGGTQEEEAKATAEKIVADFQKFRAEIEKAAQEERQPSYYLSDTRAEARRLHTALVILGYPVPPAPK